MIAAPFGRSRCATLAVLLSAPLWFACGDDSTGPEDQTGATLRGSVTTFEAQVVGSGFSLASIENVIVTIGALSTESDANGEFVLRDIPLGDQVVTLSKNQLSGTYFLGDVEQGETFTLDQIQLSGGQISTQHTGTWVGTGGSTDPGSQGQIALTMILEANGNSLSGTASVESPDASTWHMAGTETGHSVDGTLTLMNSNSSCATRGTFEGTFTADTLSGTFVEVNPPAGCGSPESGIFNVVKQ